MYVCVHASVPCVAERERKRERKREGKREGERKGEREREKKKREREQRKMIEDLKKANELVCV